MSISKLITTLLVSLTCFNIIFSNIVAFSQSMLPVGSFFVSEINWDGSWQRDQITNAIKSNSEDEWIELYNPTNALVNIANYKIKGFSSLNKDLNYADPLKCNINPNSYLIVSRLATSPTITSSDVCLATNMSISNTVINYSITDKNDLMIDNFNIGDPSKITNSKNTTQKFSIYREAATWTESSKTINITQNIDSSLGYTHFGSPYGENLIVETSIPKSYMTKILPYKLDFTTNLKQSGDRWALNQKEVTVFELECKPQNQHHQMTLTIFEVYCIRLTYALQSQGQSLFGFTDYSFELKPESEPIKTSTPSTTTNIVAQLTELDLNQDQFEIYNPTTSEINLSDVFLQDTLGAVKKSKMTGWVIKPQSYAVFNTKLIGITLNNNGDNLIISDQFNTQISSSNITTNGKNQAKNSSWQYFKDTNSWEENLSTLGRENQRAATLDQISENDTDQTEDATLAKKPAAEILKSENLDYFRNKLKISEIYPEGLEYVELYNDGDHSLELGGLKIKDMQGKISTLSLPANTKIDSKSYLKIDLKGKISLNNGGDGIVLLTSQDDEIGRVVYQKSQGIDKSYQLQLPDEDWFWSKTTPGTANLNTENSDKSEIDLESDEENTNKSTEDPVQNCIEISAYIQTSKNIFYSNLGKISIPNTPAVKLPAKVLACDLKTNNNSNSAKFKKWLEPLGYDNREILDDRNNPKNLQFVQFKLACKGKKTVDIVRSDISFKAALGSVKPGCVDGFVSGLGFVEKTTKNYNLFYLVSSKISFDTAKDLVRTGGQEPRPEIFKLFEILHKCWRILTLQHTTD